MPNNVDGTMPNNSESDSPLSPVAPCCHIWHHIDVVKTTVYLHNDLALRLRQLAAAQRRPQAELIRDALETYSRKISNPASRGFGKFSSGETDVSERAEEILMDAAKRGRWR